MKIAAAHVQVGDMTTIQGQFGTVMEIDSVSEGPCIYVRMDAHTRGAGYFWCREVFPATQILEVTRDERSVG